MKTQKLNGLHFRKGTVVELNDGEMLNVDGGTSVPCGVAASIASSAACAIISVFAAGVAYGIYDHYQNQAQQQAPGGLEAGGFN